MGAGRAVTHGYIIGLWSARDAIHQPLCRQFHDVVAEFGVLALEAHKACLVHPRNPHISPRRQEIYAAMRGVILAQ